MDFAIWVSIYDGKIVGTPFGPEVPDGKYLLVEKLDSDGGGEPNVHQALCQYRNDLLYIPTADSKERRLEMIDDVLSTITKANNPKES